MTDLAPEAEASDPRVTELEAKLSKLKRREQRNLRQARAHGFLDGILALLRPGDVVELEEAMSVVDKFGTDARSITRTLESIKDPEQLEKAVQTENVEKFVDRSKQANN